MANESQSTYSLENYIEELNKLRSDPNLLVFQDKTTIVKTDKVDKVDKTDK